jgi:hypothetical protein
VVYQDTAHNQPDERLQVRLVLEVDWHSASGDPQKGLVQQISRLQSMVGGLAP